MTLPIGSFVEISGLEKAPLYNGIVGLIVELPKDERYGVQLLDHAQDWKEEESSAANAKLAVGGKILGVKEANLKARKRDSPHWRVPSYGDVSILERVRLDFGNLDRCNELARGIWNCFFETIPGMPLTLDHGFHFRKAIVSDSNLNGHSVFWLYMDAVQHHMIVEKCRGRYRVFQAFVDDAPVMPGYTAKDWCGSFHP